MTDNQVVGYWSLLGQWTGKNPISFDLKSNEKRLKKYIHFEQKVPENGTVPNLGYPDSDWIWFTV